jgi:hypothetical protein
MKKQWNFRRLMMGGGMQIVLAVFLVTAISLLNFDANATGNNDTCSDTSTYAQNACNNAANEVYQLALGKCENELDRNQDGCESDAKDELKLAIQDCTDQFDARQEICKQVGPGPYLPTGIKRFNFVDNPKGNDFYPLTPATYTYKSFDADGNIIETDVVKVTANTRGILVDGKTVKCRVVQDTVYTAKYADPTMKSEDTIDWFAQQDNGDVWYFGEIAQQFIQDNSNSNGSVTLVGIDGSWTAGLEGAKPGIAMFADPLAHKGKTYRQEFALGEAEDDAQVVEIFDFKDLNVKVHNLYPTYDLSALNNLKTSHAPITPNTKILHTHDFSAQDPTSVLEGVYEDKFYAKGVGVILIIANDASGIVEVLVDYTKP